MKYEHLDLLVPGQKTGTAGAQLYLLDALSVAPEKCRPMVIVVPGGGYSRKSDREAEPIALRFLAMGCHACILDYSVAPNHFPTALQELSLAIAKIRERAGEWHVDTQAILVCGFSAGGHLAGTSGVYWNQPVAYEPIGRTPEEIRPNGLILCYPVVTAGRHAHRGSFENLTGIRPGEPVTESDMDAVYWQGELTAVQAMHASPAARLHYASLERHITPSTPPVFLWHTVTDETVPVENTLLLATALQQSGVPYELHIYPKGRHGLSLANEETAGTRENSVEPCCQSWISLVQLWIETNFMKIM
jgi:acetyl esterase/lipase